MKISCLTILVVKANSRECMKPARKRRFFYGIRCRDRHKRLQSDDRTTFEICPIVENKNSAGQLACRLSAALYGAAAIYGKRFSRISPAASAAGTMICEALIVVPLSAMSRPWDLQIGLTAIWAAFALAFLCTGLALLLYFRLVRTIGSMGVVSQAYLRAGIGVILGTPYWESKSHRQSRSVLQRQSLVLH